MRTFPPRLPLCLLAGAAAVLTLTATGCAPKETAVSDAQARKKFMGGPMPPEYQKKMAEGMAKSRDEAIAKAQADAAAKAAAPPR